MRVILCFFVVIILLKESVGVDKNKDFKRNSVLSQNDTKSIKYNDTKSSLVNSERRLLSKISVSKACVKNKTRFLKKERMKLQRLLKNKTKIEASKISKKLQKINLHLKKCRMKNKQPKKQVKKKVAKQKNIFDVTTDPNINSLKKTITDLADNSQTSIDENSKPQSDDYTIIENDKLHINGPSGNLTQINDLLYNTDEDLKAETSIRGKNSKSALGSKHNKTISETTPSKLDTNSLAVGEGKNFLGHKESNTINYANLMAFEVTTSPPLNNISLQRILNEFNAIHNEIQEILPNKADYHKSKWMAKEKKANRSNRCSFKNGGCHHRCHPFGAKQCSCMPGFKLINRRKCLDVNECFSKNGGCESFCHNTPGSYYCSCNEGFRLSDNQKTCTDINECLLRNGHGPCQDTCINTYGSYKCSCSGLNGTKLSEDKHSCQDVDECLENNGGCSHFCVNTLGRAYCICPEGLILGFDWKSCVDVNECEDEEVNKHCYYGCINTIGSFRCANNYELQSDQMVPDLIACPKLYPPKLGFLECTREKSLRVNLHSKSGRKRITNRPGTFCKLVCPDGYEEEGMFKITCGYDGEWFGEQLGICKKR